jgi:tetratricopeptide (TPR) repeat protein
VMQVHCPGSGADGCTDVTVVDHVKLIRNRPELRFEGRIHEQLLPAIRRVEGEVAWTDFYVVHSGSDHSPEGWQRKLERDLRILHRELEERPDHPFVLFNLGMTYADAKRYDEAIDYLKRCLEVSRPEESHLRKGYALLVSSLAQANRHEEAWSVCQEGKTLYPDDKELLFRSAMLHHHFGRLQDAEQAYLSVLHNTEKRHFTSIDQGLAGYKARHNLALVYEEMGHLDQSESQWRQITRDVPEYTAGWRGLGEILIRRNDFATAERESARLLKKEGALHREGIVLRGRLAAARGDSNSAICDFEEADRLDPTELEPLRWICRHFYEQDDLAAAEERLQQLAERAPDDAAALHNLGTIQSRRQAPDDAIQSYRRSLDLRPESADTWLQLGWALRDSGQTDEALPAWREVIRRVPDHPGALAALAEFDGGFLRSESANEDRSETVNQSTCCRSAKNGDSLRSPTDNSGNSGCCRELVPLSQPTAASSS